MKYKKCASTDNRDYDNAINYAHASQLAQQSRFRKWKRSPPVRLGFRRGAIVAWARSYISPNPRNIADARHTEQHTESPPFRYPLLRKTP